MALINCWECGKQISDQAKACPYCGAPKKLANSSAAKETDSKNSEKEQLSMPSSVSVDAKEINKNIRVKQKNSNKTLLLIVAGLIILISFIVANQQVPEQALETTKAPVKTQKQNYTIGERGPASGWIIYDKGNYKNGWRYLEAAPEDIRGKDKYVQWAPDYKIIGAFDIAIGTGKINTRKIVKALGYGEYAARLCVDYRGGGKDDWFLPSMEELNLLYKRLYKKGIGNMEKSFYWSSSEHPKGYHAKNLTFNDGEYFTNAKIVGNSVRPIRQF